MSLDIIEDLDELDIDDLAERFQDDPDIIDQLENLDEDELSDSYSKIIEDAFLLISNNRKSKKLTTLLFQILENLQLEHDEEDEAAHSVQELMEKLHEEVNDPPGQVALIRRRIKNLSYGKSANDDVEDLLEDFDDIEEIDDEEAAAAAAQDAEGTEFANPDEWDEEEEDEIEKAA